jgi:hypothetical protein
MRREFRRPFHPVRKRRREPPPAAVRVLRVGQPIRGATHGLAIAAEDALTGRQTEKDLSVLKVTGTTGVESILPPMNPPPGSWMLTSQSSMGARGRRTEARRSAWNSREELGRCIQSSQGTTVPIRESDCSRAQHRHLQSGVILCPGEPSDKFM